MAFEIGLGSLVPGSIRNEAIHAAAEIERSKLALQSLASFPQKLTDFRVWDAPQTNLPGTPATDDLGLVYQTFGTGPVQIQTGDLKAAGATTRYAGILLTLPDGYEADGNVTIRCRAGMKTTVSDTTATIDIEAYQINDDGTLSSDLCTTAATTINSLTLANKDFTITDSTLVAGSRLDVRVGIAINDGASATAVIGVLHDFILRCNCRP